MKTPPSVRCLTRSLRAGALLFCFAAGAWAQDGALDLNWIPKDAAGHEIWTDNVGSISVQPDGKILASTYYSFRAATDAGLELIAGPLIRLNADGLLDSSFNAHLLPLEPIGNPSLHGGPIALQPDGKVILGGGSLGSYFAFGRVNLNGTLDFGVRLFISGQPAGPSSITLQPDGKILVGGTFDGMDLGLEGPVIPTGRNIARFNSDGSLDPSFNAGSGTGLRPGLAGGTVVNSVALQPDGKILIGGSFQTYNEVPRNGIARLHADGSLDEAFAVDWEEVGIEVSINVVRLLPDGKILLGCTFFTQGGGNSVLLLNADGSFAFSFPPVQRAGGFGEVRTILVQPDGRILIGGSFDTVGGVSRRNIARLNTDGTLDASFDPGNGTTLPLTSIGLQPDGGLIVAGGLMQTVDGVARPWIARLHTNLGTPAGTAPTIVQPPRSQQLFAGDSTTLRVLANGSGPFEFQWRRNAVDIPGATGSKLILANLLPENAGTYSVVVSNSSGSIESPGAQVGVLIPLLPLSYSMLNGEHPSAPGFHDETYTGAGNPNENLSPLSGGVGELSDGIRPEFGFHSHWVGWYTVEPSIIFDFGGHHEFVQVAIHTQTYTDPGVITFPSVDVSFSDDGINFSSAVHYTTTGAERMDGFGDRLELNGTHWINIPLSGGGRFVRVNLHNPWLNSQFIMIGEISIAAGGIELPPPEVPANVTPQLQINRSGFRFNRATQRYVQTVTIKNVGGAALTGPVSLVLDQLPSAVTLAGASGATSSFAPLGSPFIVWNIGADNSLAVGESAAAVLQFVNPSNTGISYTLRAYAGSGSL